MNKDNAKYYLPLLQALAEGRTLQHAGPKWEWVDLADEVSFNYSPNCYRIKPEPKEIWVVEHNGGLFDEFTTKAEAEHLSVACHSRLALYREVIE